ncbi:hypothetical protein SEA_BRYANRECYCLES_63 [Streptomyces phage BryanRecycles]|uniref:DUF7448 domain-containing protein n=1 Tax=Streptomyces phage BryanRecycles TaxID=2024287 RepID=A0A291AVJ9_9CAUD|nr:hypothetical protein SEA_BRYANRECYCLES_63 [Streptomyces phage BryanRecycles]
MSWYSSEPLDKVVGATVKRIFWSDDRLILDTDQGAFVYDVEGDCCSHSYFFDLIGVEKLLNNGPIVNLVSHDLDDDDIKDDDYTYTQVYGYRFETEHPTWGLMSSVVSFRNESNGYYGGWMQLSFIADAIKLDRLLADGGFEELTADKIG